jgi:hypothetical protein
VREAVARVPEAVARVPEAIARVREAIARVREAVARVPEAVSGAGSGGFYSGSAAMPCEKVVAAAEPALSQSNGSAAWRVSAIGNAAQAFDTNASTRIRVHPWPQTHDGRGAGTGIAFQKLPMIQANCRDRFTAEDFDFVVKTLSKSSGDTVGLTELLTDAAVRDSILDHELLVQSILSQTAQLSISPQFYFYVLIRHVLKETGIADRRLCDYVASLLETFSKTARMKSPADGAGGPIQYLSDMLLALRKASPSQEFLIRAHVGNYSLFITGIFHESVQKRSERGAPDFSFYEETGRMNYKVVASHSVARACDLSDIYAALAEQFHEIRLALNRMSDRLLNIGDEAHIPLIA